MRILIAILLSLITLTACSPYSADNSQTHSKKSGIEEKVKNDEKEVNKNEEVYSNPQMSEKLNFNKDILLVKIMEVNNEALNERPTGGITSQDSYVMDKNLFLFYDAELPTKGTNMIILEENLNHDYLLDYKTHQVDKGNVGLNIEAIENEYVNNKNRLFTGNTVNVEHTGAGEIKVLINGETIEIGINEEKEVVKSNGDIESKIVIVNYGLINSIDNITYQELDEVDKANLPDEYKRESDRDSDDCQGSSSRCIQMESEEDIESES